MLKGIFVAVFGMLLAGPCLAEPHAIVTCPPTITVRPQDKSIDVTRQLVVLHRDDTMGGCMPGEGIVTHSPLRWFGITLMNPAASNLLRIFDIYGLHDKGTELRVFLNGKENRRLLASGANFVSSDIQLDRSHYAVTIPRGHPITVLLGVDPGLKILTVSLQDVPSYLEAALQRKLVACVIIGVLLLTMLFQLILVPGSSDDYPALTILIISALFYEVVSLSDTLPGISQIRLPIAEFALQFCLVMVAAATWFAATFFEVTFSGKGFPALFRVVYGMLGLMLVVSFSNDTAARQAAEFTPFVPMGAVAAAAVYRWRPSRHRVLAFLLACAPAALGAVVGSAVVSGDLSLGPGWRQAGDAGLVITLLTFVFMGRLNDDKRRREGEDQLRDTQRRYQLALEGSNDGIFEWDLVTREVLASRRAHEIVGVDYEAGWRPQALWQGLIPSGELDRFRSMPESLFAAGDTIRVETWVQDPRGEKLYLLLQGKVEIDPFGKPVRVTGSLSDVSAQKRLEERLRHDALHDFLTGLPNRTLLTDRIKRVIQRLRRNPEARAALLFVGLDNFKSINDNLGHGFGDQVLVSLADRLVEFVRISDTVARFAGDEFVILLEDMFSHREAERFANRILTRIQSPMEIQRQHLVPSVSIGLTMVEDPNMSAETVLGDADIAMYAAKESGKGRVVAFETTMRTRAAKRLKLESALHDAIDNEELYLTYQPIFSIDQGEPRAMGVEALLRWNKSDREDIAPSDLISLAEENGMIEEIGRWVIRTAARQLAQWRDLGYPEDFYININLSSVHFESDDIVSTILKEVDPLGVPRNSLRIEIVETAVIRYPEKALSVIKLLQSQGILVSIDDFGTGFSSLSYLHRFPFHALKIDRSFVLEIAESKATRDIITAIVALARRLGIKVVAEGIETRPQLDFLKSVGCHLGQGFLLARPAGSVDHLFAGTARPGVVEPENVRRSPAPATIHPQYQ